MVSLLLPRHDGRKGWKMKRKTVVSSVLIVLFVISVFPTSTLSGVADSHGSSEGSESHFTVRLGVKANDLVAPATILQQAGGTYTDLLGTTFTQNFTSMFYNVTAVAQGSAAFPTTCLLCGLSDAGYLYEAGLTYSGSVFQAAFIIFDQGGMPMSSYSDKYGMRLLTNLQGINQWDTVLLTLSFTSGSVSMSVTDWIQNSPLPTSASKAWPTFGATKFVGNDTNAPPWNIVYSFTGLMTEYTSLSPLAGNMPEEVYSNMTSAQPSAWMWMQQFGPSSWLDFGTSPVFFPSGYPQVRSFTSHGATEYSTAYQFVIGDIPSISISPSSANLDFFGPAPQSQTFTSSVSGGTSPYSYQWFLNGALVSTLSSWTFTPSSRGTYTVYATVTDNVGAQATSNTATVTVQSVYVVPTQTLTLASAIASAQSGDVIYVQNVYSEALSANLVILQDNLSIIGGPPQLGMPNIDVNGHHIEIHGSRLFMWGLNITSTLFAQYGEIWVMSSATYCLIMNNTLSGDASSGITVFSSYNTIALNTLNVTGPLDGIGLAAPNNIIKGNTLWNYGVGIEVTGGAAYNKIYWNNLMATNELLDTNPSGSGPDYFDDTTGKGNFEITWTKQGPFPVPGPNNYADNFPRSAPWNSLTGDINVDGKVGLADLVLLARAFISKGSKWVTFAVGWDPRCDLSAVWGSISLADLVALANNYGKADP